MPAPSPASAPHTANPVKGRPRQSPLSPLARPTQPRRTPDIPSSTARFRKPFPSLMLRRGRSNAQKYKAACLYLTAAKGSECRSQLGSEGSFQRKSHLERLDRMKHVRECRLRGRRYSRSVGVVDIVVFAIQQIQKLRRYPPSFPDLIPHLGVQQHRRIRPINSI